MSKSSLFKSSLQLAALLAFTAIGFAQAPVPPKAFSGTIVGVADDNVTLQDKDGKNFTVQLAHGCTVSTDRKGTPRDIKPGDFIKAANVPVSTHNGRVTELEILEPGYRPEDGNHVVSADDHSMITHGTVKTATRTDGGYELEVTYTDGSRFLLVPPQLPISIADPLDRSALKPGVAVTGVTRPGADGVERAGRLQIANQ